MMEIGSKIATNANRLDLFVIEYNKEFKKQQITNTLFQDTFQPNILRLMKGPLILYALKLNGQVLIDLVAILEQYAIFYITELFSSFPARQDMVTQLIDRQFLNKLAQHLITLGLWDKKDKKDVDELGTARNYIAHKNVKKVSKILNNGNPISIPEIDLVMSKMDALPYIILTMRHLLKLMD